MKMKAEHYNTLKALISVSSTVKTHGVIALEVVYVSGHEEGSIKAKDIHERLRWDLFRTIPDKIREGFITAMYTYLNDDHIDTALKQVMIDLSAEEGANTPIETL